MKGRMDRGLRSFAKVYLVVVAVFFPIAYLVATLIHQDLLLTLAQVYFGIGFAYIVASTFAWSGLANLYRYSPTLFLGSRTYREQILRGSIWKEGRDNGAFLLGVSFGGALMGLGAALFEPIFILVDAAVVALVLLVLYARHARSAART